MRVCVFSVHVGIVCVGYTCILCRSVHQIMNVHCVNAVHQ